ncbi:hypothetical protein QBC42DRAFT_92694 [Cladorrhinum samala]|uniref:Transglutaminase-like domain-containing protein n=1 Tax=Cladorrhinum samala TaxID=585594 RepID=A0AAV9HKU8_9PEZI|nr:hypothetical protein QBC42DRAFT_92694 [Cladorrhinum samala]
MAATFRPSSLLSRTTTGISELLTKHRSEKESSTWPNTELSIGRFIKKIGKINCWEATGPAREAFNNIAPRIRHHLEREVEPISSWVTWSIYMFGKVPKHANPTIVFCCEVSAHRKEVKDIVMESGLLDGYPGIKTAHMPRAPDFDQLIPLAGGPGPQSSSAKTAFTSTTSLVVDEPGMRIFVGDSGSPATIGGIIQVADSLFYATAGHVFQNIVDNDNPQTGDDDDGIEIDGFDASDIETDGETESIFEMGLKPRTKSIFRTQKTVQQQKVIRPQITGPPKPSPLDRVALNHPYLTSYDGPDPQRNLDYALIKITHPIPAPMNEVEYFHHSTASEHGQSETLQIKTLADLQPSEQKVLAITSRGIIAGVLSGTPVYARQPHSSGFQMTYSVGFQSPLEVGDCGSWVVNSKTGALYGHIVAGSPQSGAAIVVPFHSIFEDIERRLGSPPTLPNTAPPPPTKVETSVIGPAAEAALAPPLSDSWPRYMAGRFQAVFKAHLAQSLSKQARSGVRKPLHLLPRPPAPGDNASQRFRNMLFALSEVPMRWEEPGLLDEALSAMPLDRIYARAEEEYQLLISQARERGDDALPEWGYQDCVMRAILGWFKREFFVWVNFLPCSRCQGATTDEGIAAPTPEERVGGALKVELHKCATPGCGKIERFPRYNSVWYLLQTRRGRVGEWAQCFGALCRAVGARTRWVWNAEDHAWLEVYSEHKGRWVHVDPCEEVWDNPTMYTEGWRKELSYCVAFGLEGAVDVTRRYLRKDEFAKDRGRCPEPVLPYILQEISTLRRENLTDEARARLKSDDEREEEELRKYIVDSIVKELSDAAKGKPSAQKRAKHVGGTKLDTAAGAAETERPKQREAARSGSGSGDVFYEV